MDFEEKLCEVCGDQLINCPHTNPRCLLMDSHFTVVWPFTIDPILIRTEQKSSATVESTKPKAKKSPKPAEPAKSPQFSSEDEESDDEPVIHRYRSKGRKRPISSSDSSETAADSIPEGSEIDQHSTPTRKKAKRAKVDGGKRQKSDQTDKKTRKRRASESDSDDSADLTTQSIRGSSVSTPIDDQMSDVQEENSVDNQMELDRSGNEADNESDRHSVAFSPESPKSDSSNEPNTPLSEEPSDADDIDDEIVLAMSELSDQFDNNLASQQISKIIDLIRKNMENSRVLLSCQQLIDRYDFATLRRLGSSLIYRLINTLLSVVKHHCGDSEIVENFCHLAKSVLDGIGIGPDRCEIDWFLEVIDDLLKISCDDYNLTATAILSTLKLLKKIIQKSDAEQKDSIGQSCLENFCKSINDDLLEEPDYDEVMLIRCDCLFWICHQSVANQRIFLSGGGLKLVQQCYLTYEKCDLSDWDCGYLSWITSIRRLMEELSKEESILDDLMANGNPEILWQIWRGRKLREIWTFCRRIFTKFLSKPPETWPFALPTVKQIKKQLRMEPNEFSGDEEDNGDQADFSESNAGKHPISSSDSSESAADSTPEGSEIDQPSTPTRKRAKREKIDRFEPEIRSTDQTGKKTLKRRSSQSNSDDSGDLTAESIRASSVSTPIADDVGDVQQANLPISSTATQENSDENQMELDQTGNDADENNLDFVAFSPDSPKSDSFDSFIVPDSPLSATDPIDKPSVGQQIFDWIMLVRNNIEDVDELLECQQLFSLSRFDLSGLGSSVIGSLIDTLMSVVKRHCDDSLIVRNFCDLAKSLLNDPDRYLINEFIDSIDLLLEIGCDQTNLTTTAVKSTLKLVEKIVEESYADQINLIGRLAVEKFCQSIKGQLDQCEFDKILLIRCGCLFHICERSVANQKKLLNAGGLRLVRECWKNQGWKERNISHKLSSGDDLIRSICILMERLSKRKSVVNELMADGNPKILWQMWRHPEWPQIRTFCRRIFANFHSESPLIWPIANPTVEEVGIQLKLNI